MHTRGSTLEYSAYYGRIILYPYELVSMLDSR